MPTPTAEPASRLPDRLLLVGVALLAAGAATLVCRYKLLPLGIDDTMSSLLTGAPIAACVIGVMMMRTALQRGAQRRAGWLLGVSLAAAGLAAGVFVLVAPSRSPDGISLRAWTVPGVRVGLPDWPVASERSDSLPGQIVVDDPMGRGRFVELRWAVGEPLSDDAIAAAASEAGPLSPATSEAVTVDGRPARVSLLESASGDARVAATSFQCPATRIAVTLITSADLRRDALLALHRRLLATVDCAPLAPEEKPRDSFPSFTPPPGYTRAEHPVVQAWVGEDDGVFDLPPGLPGERRAHALDEIPGTREQILRAELGLQKIRFDPSPLRRPGPGGTPRTVWQATAEDKAGTPVRALLTWWHCEADDNSYVAIHAGPATIPLDPVVASLAAAACP
ncbi:MAG: hypothetical protein H6744_07765 [Deltaproteobacteria bacterium]|nr:hypothetical protein [Deltaproteobacteria bacterium]